MDAAQALFLEKGFAATSVDEIVKRADVAKGTFYLQFKTKDDVLLALQDRFVATFHEKMQEALDSPPEGDWHRRLDSWIETLINGYLDNVDLHDLVFHNHHATHLRMGHDNPVITQIATFIAGGTRAGAWTVKDAHMAGVMLFYAAHGSVDAAIVDPKPPKRKALIEAVKTFCRQALGIGRI